MTIIENQPGTGQEPKVIGYGRNKEVTALAKPAFPTRIVFEWSTDDGCHSGKFEVKNIPNSQTLSKCDLQNLPCRKDKDV